MKGVVVDINSINSSKLSVLHIEIIRAFHGSRGFQNLAGQVGSFHNISKSHGPGRVGSGRINRL